MTRASILAALLTLNLMACGQEVQSNGGVPGDPPGSTTSSGAATGAPCPEQWPSYGTPCNVEGQICEYYDVQCDDGGPSTSHRCTDGIWEEAPTGCSVCPAQAPVAGGECDPSLPTYGCEYTVETPCGSESVRFSCDGPGAWRRATPSTCEAACGDYNDEAACAAADCQWLVPGCGEGSNALLEAGCFPSVSCDPGSCIGDTTCQSVTYDPCRNSSCNACGAETTVCL